MGVSIDMDAYSPEDIGEIQYIVYYNPRDFYTLTYNQIRELNHEYEGAVIKKEDHAFEDKEILKFSSQKAVQKAITLFELKINVYFNDDSIQLTHKQIADFNQKYPGAIKRIHHPQFGKCFAFTSQKVAQKATGYFNLMYRVFKPDSSKYLEFTFDMIDSVNRYHANAITKIVRSDIQGFGCDARFNSLQAIQTSLKLMEYSQKNNILPGKNLVQIPDLTGDMHTLDKLAFQYGHQIGSIYVPPDKQDLTFAGLSENNNAYRKAQLPSLLARYLMRGHRIVDVDSQGNYRNEYVLSAEALKTGYIAGFFVEAENNFMVLRREIKIKDIIEEMRYEQNERNEMYDTIVEVSIPRVYTVINKPGKSDSPQYEELELSEKAVRFGFINNWIFTNEDGHLVLSPEKSVEELEKFAKKPDLYKTLEINSDAVELDKDEITDAYERCKTDSDYYRENSYNIERAYKLLMHDELSFFYLTSGDAYLYMLDKYAPTALDSKSFQYIIPFKR